MPIRRMSHVAGMVIGLPIVIAAAGCAAVMPEEPGTLLVSVFHTPECPVPVDTTRFPEECESRNVADAAVFVTASGDVVAEGRTDPDGRVELELPPGAYFVHVGDRVGLRTPYPLLIDVESGQESGAIVTYTPGIRVDIDIHRP